MKQIKKTLLTLVALLALTTGARADWTGGTYTATATENLGAITVNGDATLTINSDVTVTITGGINVASGTLTVKGPGTLVVNGAKGNDGASGWKGNNGGNGGVAISGNIIVQGGATVTATGGNGGTGGSGALEAGNGGNGGVAFAGTLTYKSGTVTANGGSAGSGGYIDDEERYASSGSAGKAFANDVDFTQTTGYSVTNGTSTIGSVLNQTKVVISGGTEPASSSGPEVAWDKASKTGTFTMPGDNLTLEPEYYPQAALTAAPTAINDVLATTDGAIVNAGTVANIGETTTAQGQLMYYVSQTALDDDALLALAADQWTADVPTAAHLAEGTAYVYYYIRGNDSDTDEENFSDGDILAANALTVTIAAPPVAVTGVTLPSTATVTLGDAVALTAAVEPADATDKKVKWTVTAGTDKVKLYTDADCKTEVGTDATDALTVYAKGLAVGEATVKVESNGDATKTATCAVTAKHGTYAVAMKAGVTDGDQWTAKAGQDGQYQAMPLKGVEGGTKPVELKYGGDLEVKRVTMRVLPAWKGDLSKLSATELESDGVTVLVKNGMTLTGTLSANYKITIADGATVTLDGVTINGTDDENYKWAGLNCLGTATIVLKDGTENTVKGFHSDYPGIHVPMGSTLTIEGPGKLTASSNGKGAGIGGGKNLGCGNIVIAATVGMVKAIKGSDAPYSIGAGDESTCGTVTIGGTVYYDGSDYQNDGATYLAQDQIEYPTPVAFAANEYNEASWDGSKVVFTKKTAASTPTAVANSNTAVTWGDGWYTVAGEVTISGNVTLTADTYLILQDGATLTINGQLNANTNQKNLYIYGQKKGDGKLNVICSNDRAIYGEINKTVEIHGGEITAEGKTEGLTVGYIKVFSGKITATCGYNSRGITFMNSCDVYGGEIEGTTNESGISRGISDGGNGGTFTVYGGKVKGTGGGVQLGPNYGSSFDCKVKSGTAGIKFYFRDNGTDWDEGTYYETATAAPKKKYAKAE